MLSLVEKINKIIHNRNILELDINENEHLTGFALFRKYEDKLEITEL